MYDRVKPVIREVYNPPNWNSQKWYLTEVWAIGVVLNDIENHTFQESYFNAPCLSNAPCFYNFLKIDATLYISPEEWTGGQL
jgi:hypothetical protein